jgi:hypothetical protein
MVVGRHPVGKPRLADFLVQSAGLDVELLTPKSITADGEDIGEIYYIMNAVEAIRAIDHSKSVAELSEEGSILYFNEIWLHDNAVGMRAIAREYDSGDLLISQELADSMIQNKFKGDNGLGFYIVNRLFNPYKKQA